MSQINMRIKYVRKEIAKLTLVRFAERIGVSAASISAIELGKNNPSDQTVKSICREFGIREEWLRTGEGTERIAQSKDEEISSFLHSVLKDEPETFRRRLVAAMAKWTEQDWENLAHLAETITEGK